MTAFDLSVLSVAAVFLVGGILLGIVVAACLVAASDADDVMEEQQALYDWEKEWWPEDIGA